jgi:hypothetical protein
LGTGGRGIVTHLPDHLNKIQEKMKELEAKMNEMKKRGFSGFSVTLSDAACSKKEIAKDMMAMLNSITEGKCVRMS